MKQFVLATAVFTLVAAPLSGQTLGVVTPEGVFGPQPGQTFGGTGIPNDAVMVNSAFSQQAMGGTHMFLSAAQRYNNPALGNDGAGTFFALSGTDQNAPSPADPYALWNFNFSIIGDNAAAWTYRLWFDFNPAVGNSGDYGYVTIIPTQDSWNLGMNFLTIPSWPVVVPPGYGPFDPNAEGEYGFALLAYDEKLVEMSRVAILVDVENGGGGGEGDVVPEPATLLLLATGLVGLAVTGRRPRARRS